jgi:adhesin HecA-like repeat protein
LELDAFTSDLGLSQGRVVLSTEPRTAVLVLGHLSPRHTARLRPGDHVQAEQEVDLTAERLLQTQGTLGVQDDLAPGLAWEVSLCVGGTKRARLLARAGEVKSISDLAVNVSADEGLHVVALRLELVEDGD